MILVVGVAFAGNLSALDTPAGPRADIERPLTVQPLVFNPGEHALPSTGSTAKPPVLHGFSAKLWAFSEASSEDYVLEVLKGSERHALYTHVDALAPSPDGRTLFLRNATRKGEGWQPRVRLIDVATKKYAELPALDCVGYGASWEGEHLVTWGAQASKGTPFCVFDRGGSLKAHVAVSHAAWRAFAADEHVGRFGVHRGDPSVVWYADPWGCTLELFRPATGASRVVPLEQGDTEPPEPCQGFSSVDPSTVEPL